MSDHRTGADLVVEALQSYGIGRVFGNPGTTELPLLRAVGDSDLEYVLGLHEDVAVGMAAGYATARRQRGDNRPLGVVNLHLAPGMAHGLCNLYGAWMNGAPVVVTAGAHSTDFRHEEPILSGDAVSMTDQFTKWSTEVPDVAALPTMLRRAVRTALTPPTGPVFLALPVDVLMSETDATPERLGSIPTAGPGDPAALDRAAAALVAAENPPVFVLGDGVARAGGSESAVALAEAAGARVHGEILAGEVAFPGDHEQWASFIPPDESAAREAMDAETLLFAGCSTNTTLTRHENPLVSSATTCIHVSDAPRELGKNHPADAAVLGDPAAALAALAERVTSRLDEEERERRVARATATAARIREQARRDGAPDDPGDARPSKAELVDALYRGAPDALVVDEGVSSKYVLLSRIGLQPDAFTTNKGGGLGYGLPAALGAAVAEGDRADGRRVVGFVGDGAFLYYSQALFTAARHDLDVTVVVVDNRNYRILKNNARSLLGAGSEEGLPGVDFDPPVDLVANAESYGVRAQRVERADAVETAVREAVDRKGPDLLDVEVRE